MCVDRPCENTTDKRPVSDADGDPYPASTLVSESGPSIKVSTLKLTKTRRKHVRLASQILRSAVIASLVSDNVTRSSTTTIVPLHRFPLVEINDIYAALLRYRRQRRSLSLFSSPTPTTSMFGRHRQRHALHRYHPPHLSRCRSPPSKDRFIFPLFLSPRVAPITRLLGFIVAGSPIREVQHRLVIATRRSPFFDDDVLFPFSVMS